MVDVNAQQVRALAHRCRSLRCGLGLATMPPRCAKEKDPARQRSKKTRYLLHIYHSMRNLSKTHGLAPTLFGPLRRVDASWRFALDRVT